MSEKTTQDIPRTPEEIELWHFQVEIAELAIQERLDYVYGKPKHFFDIDKPEVVFDASRLEKTDMDIWRKEQAGLATREDFDEYAKTTTDPAIDHSRIIFSRFIANKISISWMKKQMEERKKGNDTK